jgi:hypothetical protein
MKIITAGVELPTSAVFYAKKRVLNLRPAPVREGKKRIIPPGELLPSAP